MWICSKLGFFSIVRRPDEFGRPGDFHVRARSFDDLVRLKSAADLDAEIRQSADTDYRWRMVIGSGELRWVMAILGAGIDYPNFKEAIARRSDQRAKLEAYEEFWGRMRELQDG